MGNSSRRALLAASIGNFCEIYDFAVFGFSVPVLSAQFFPGTDRTAALLSTFAVYAVAFFARPVGGLWFGFIADRVGRVRVMALTVWLMALGTASIGLLPTYQHVGIAAPVLLVVCRMAQGIALGGETTGSTSYVLESAPVARRGQWIGTTLTFSHLPNSLVAVLLVLLRLYAGSEAYADWVWRIPFVTGGLIGIVGYWLRRSLDDSEEFKQAVRTARHKNPLRDLVGQGWRGMLNVAMIQPIQTVGSYLLLGFMYTFIVNITKVDPTLALLSNAVAVVVLGLSIPIGGRWSDRIGRKPVLTAGATWVALAAYPAIYLVASGHIVAGQVLLALGVGLYGGACFVAAPEFFPTAYRATGHAISFQVAVAVYGGTTPLISTWLVHSMGTPLAPAYYVTAVALICLITVQLVPETKDILLRTARSSSSHPGPVSTDLARKQKEYGA